MSRSRSSGRSVASLLRMRSLGPLGLAAVAAFYVAWPLYAGYEINSSLETQDAARLTAKVDFPSVRISLKPLVAQKVNAAVSDALRRAGAAGELISDPLKAQIVPPMVDGILATLVTPEMMIRLHASGKSLKEALESMVLEKAEQGEGFGGLLIVPGGEGPSDDRRRRIDEIASALGIDTSAVLGGAGAKAADDVSGQGGLPVALEAKSGGKRPKYGIGNIKNISLDGPLGLSIGVARDAKASKADLTATMTFVDGSWKLTGLVPKL